MRNKSTEQIEMVETHNLYLSLKRLSDAVPYDNWRWRRALHHAVAMAGFSHDTTKKIREALDLP